MRNQSTCSSGTSSQGSTATFLGQTVLATIANEFETKLRDAIPGKTFAALQSLMFEVTSCKSTTDIIALAKHILALLKDDSQDQPNPKPQSQHESAAGGIG
ncbi:hypothetical protein ACFS07_32985 [Undibacterium arcticum]